MSIPRPQAEDGVPHGGRIEDLVPLGSGPSAKIQSSPGGVFRDLGEKVLAHIGQGQDVGQGFKVAGLLAAGTSPVLDQAVRLLARSGLFSLFLASAGAKEEQVRKTEFAEKLLRRRGKGIQEESIPFVLSGILSENKEFVFDGTSFSSVPELAARLQTYADRSPELLEKKCAGFYTAEGTLIPAFLVWMIVQGQEKALLSWHSRFHPAEESGQGEEPTLAEEGEDMPPADLQTGFIPTLKRPDPAFFLDLPGT